MEKAGWGERLKARAREMGLTDSAVAVLAGLTQRRYSSYANETREPDFRTLMVVCRVLRTTPDAILGFAQHPPLGPVDGLEARLRSVLIAMKPADQAKALAVVETMAGLRARRPNGSGASASTSRAKRSGKTGQAS